MKSHDIIPMKFQHSHTDGINPVTTANQLRRLVVYPIIYRFSSINSRPGLVLSKKQLITPNSKKNGAKTTQPELRVRNGCHWCHWSRSLPWAKMSGRCSTCVIEEHLWTTDTGEPYFKRKLPGFLKISQLNKQWLEPKQMEVDGSDDFLFQFG